MKGVSWTTAEGDDISTVLVPTLGELPAGGTITIRDCNGFHVELVVELVRGRYHCTDLRVKQLPDGEPVTGEALRAIPVAQCLRYGLNHAEALARLMGRPAQQEPAGRTEWVAHIYKRAYAVGDPPKQAVAQALGVSPATASRAISKAREVGLLREIEGPGKAGG